MCKDLVNKDGGGKCLQTSYHSHHQGFRSCYVYMPSTCMDVVASRLLPGEFYSEEACEKQGLYSLIIILGNYNYKNKTIYALYVFNFLESLFYYTACQSNYDCLNIEVCILGFCQSGKSLIRK